MEIIRYTQARVCPVQRDTPILEGPPAVEKYSKEYVAPARLSPEDVRQIVDALEQLDWVQFVKQMMASALQEDEGPETYSRRRYGRPLRTVPAIGAGPEVQARPGEVPTLRVAPDQTGPDAILRYALAWGCDYETARGRLGLAKAEHWAGADEHGRAVA